MNSSSQLADAQFPAKVLGRKASVCSAINGHMYGYSLRILCAPRGAFLLVNTNTNRVSGCEVYDFSYDNNRAALNLVLCENFKFAKTCTCKRVTESAT